MGNSALTCFRARGKVRVVLLNGDVAEFKEPVWASTVMKKYPQHIVLHCCMGSSCGVGQRRKISVLRPEQALKRKESYLITPIQATESARPFLDSWAFFALNACNKKLDAKIRHKGSAKRRCLILTVFDKIFRSPQSLASSDEESTSPLLGFNQPSVESRKGPDGLPDWRPSLECILESPTHSAHSSAPQSRSSSYASYPRLDFR